MYNDTIYYMFLLFSIGCVAAFLLQFAVLYLEDASK